jgi:hypothetical protein
LVLLLWKTAGRFFKKKLKIELPHDPAISLLPIYLKELKSVSERDIFFPCSLLHYSQQPPYGSNLVVH